jgi:transposase
MILILTDYHFPLRETTKFPHWEILVSVVVPLSFLTQDERTRRLLTIPGIGALNATALVAAVGDARTFGRGRDLAAWLGLVPRQATTGGKPRLLGITKRGSRYLRKNLIQGARASLPTMSKSDTRLGA